MKRKRIQFVLIILSLFVVFGVGCTKKAEYKQDKGLQQSSAAADQKLQDDAAAKARAAEEEAARQRALREQAIKEGAMKQQAQTTPDQSANLGASPLTDIHFDFDKYSIRPKDREILKDSASWIMKNNPSTVVIEGHCDEKGTDEYNLALGDRRASEAQKYLVSLGVDGKRLKTISYGKEMPLDPGHNEDAWAKNRRAHFLVKAK
jgi:peptidoglycan-associated lipoprotein